MSFKSFLTPQEIKELQVLEATSDKAQKRTPEQIQAIYTYGHNILVSASAGSGKTFVMVERIVDKLLRGVSIKALFISTFTVKAAGELRERLEKELKKAIRNTDDELLRQHLSQQLVDLPVADIGTMDAFTQKLVSEYGYLLGISPQFRILTDKSEQDVMQQDIYQDLFTSYMSGKDHLLFDRLVRNFSIGRKDDKGFQDAVKRIYQFIQSTANPRRWMEDVFMLSAREQSQTRVLPDEMIQGFLDSISMTADALEDITNLPDYKQTTAKGAPTATYKKHQVMIIQLREWVADFSIHYGKEGLGRLALEVSELLPSSSEITVAGIKYPVFKELQAQLSEFRHLDTILDYQPETLPLLDLLKSFVLDFQAQYFERKKAENAFEFADISHLAIAILENDADVRQSYQNRFHEVMVDEYQDTNHTQEAMLDLLSNGHNRFMVGDIKQSIYRFRQADPQLFNQKFKDYQQPDSQGELILLKENFRSQNEVLKATNSIFSRLMDEAVGEITYDDKHQLVAGSAGQMVANPKNETEYLIYDTDKVSDDTEQLISKGEVELVIKEIIRLHQEEGVAFKDITLLVASRSRNKAILSAFERHGIPLVTDGGQQNYLQSLEVMVMLDTLRTINNPLNDYPLIALLKSPMFQLTEDDLTRLSLQGQRMAFYHKLHLAQTKTGKEPDLITDTLMSKIDRFMSTLTQWRDYSKINRLHDLIWKIYQDRLYYDHVGAMSNGEKRQANLYALALRADSFEKTGFKGLSRFISMIDRILASQNDLADVEIPVPKDAVNLMTIHKSKGLQFKYVFVLNMDKPFDRPDEMAPLILSRHKGIGIKYVADMKERFADSTDLPHVKVSMNTLSYQFNQHEAKLARLSEHMRLLYVAMTRAEQKLYLVGKGSREKLENKYSNESKGGRLTVKARETMTSFQDWFLAIFEAFPSADLGIKLSYVTDADLTTEQIGQLQPVLPIKIDDLTENRQSDTIKRALDMMESVDCLNQTYEKAIKLPTVRTPSQVKAYYEPVLETEGMDIIEKKPLKASFTLPDFSNKVKVTGAAKGSALHELMQRLPLEQEVTLDIIQSTLDEVKADDNVKESLDLTHVKAFFTTDLGQTIQKHLDRLHREAPFAMLHPDKESGESFVMRGIIDGYLLFDDKIVLFDYKTDRFEHSGELKERYKGQMALYAQALRQAYGIEKVETYLVLLGGKELEVVSYDS